MVPLGHFNPLSSKTDVNCISKQITQFPWVTFYAAYILLQQTVVNATLICDTTLDAGRRDLKAKFCRLCMSHRFVSFMIGC